MTPLAAYLLVEVWQRVRKPLDPFDRFEPEEGEVCFMQELIDVCQSVADAAHKVPVTGVVEYDHAEGLAERIWQCLSAEQTIHPQQLVREYFHSVKETTDEN